LIALLVLLLIDQNRRQEELSNELEAIFNIDADESYLQQKLDKSFENLQIIGSKLSKIREVESRLFCKDISYEMSLLGFNGGEFAVELTETEHPTENGISTPFFIVKANKGEPFYRLDRTASGGEISRIMLAIKTVLADNDPVPILVFDEIDTGVGGKIASDIAQAIEKLATHHQVFVISHLHQIASKAMHHYSVYKREKSGRTITEINLLNEEERVLEIARMLGGEGEAEIKHAEKLLSK
jgi:DNA repair protein RecN (Recombination protein N)